jgi:hypothetical protein
VGAVGRLGRPMRTACPVSRPLHAYCRYSCSARWCSAASGRSAARALLCYVCVVCYALRAVPLLVLLRCAAVSAVMDAACMQRVNPPFPLWSCWRPVALSPVGLCVCTCVCVVCGCGVADQCRAGDLYCIAVVALAPGLIAGVAGLGQHLFGSPSLDRFPVPGPGLLVHVLS